MKIGILTVPFNNNYGGFLQAYALKRVLVDMGHEVIFINRRRDRVLTLKDKIKAILSALHLYKNKEKSISIYTDKFKKDYLHPFTKAYYTSQELMKCLSYKFDCVIVGSDQVWRYYYFKDCIDDFFCNFLEGTKIHHFSYAASMGTDVLEFPKYKIEQCSNLLKCFKAISVREESAVKLLKEDFGINDVQVVCDPTFLLHKQIYVDLFREKYGKPQMEYIFTYILDDNEEVQQAIREFSHKKNLQVLNIKAQTGNISEIDMIEPVEKWLSAIYYADYIITDSFHGTVFSLIFNKQFVVYGNIERGLSRMQDLLNRVGLNDRLVTTGDFIVEKLTKEINWNPVNERINANVESSMNYLRNALES